MHTLFTFLLLYAFTATDESHTLTLKVSEFEDFSGSVKIAIYRPEDDFLSTKPFKAFSLDVNGSSVSHSVELLENVYAISLYHDKNDNGKIDKSFIGIPTELYGFSNNVMGTFGPPSFEKASIQLTSDIEIEIILK